MGTGDMAGPRLRPEMSSRRLQVLAFIRDYIGQWGQSPSLREIAAGAGISRSRAHRLLKRLVQEELLINRGGPRGLALPSERDQALRLLHELGFTVFRGTKGRLLDAPALTYSEDRRGSKGDRGNGDSAERRGDEAGKEPGRPAAGERKA